MAGKAIETQSVAPKAHDPAYVYRLVDRDRDNGRRVDDLKLAGYEETDLRARKSGQVIMRVPADEYQARRDAAMKKANLWLTDAGNGTGKTSAGGFTEERQEEVAVEFREG